MPSLRALTLPGLAAAIGWPTKSIKRLLRRIEERYEPGRVPKKDGGYRDLLKPSPALKRLQRRLYHVVLRNRPVHSSVYCAPRLSALDAAGVHKRHSYLLHLDIKDFFPSVTVDRVRSALEREGVEDSFVPLLARLVTARGSLPQGAPTSPAIANLVLEPLDQRLAGLCSSSGAGLAYTRFVDDLAFSGGERLGAFEGEIRKIVWLAGWELNDRGGLLGPDEPHRLLGVIAGCELSLGEDYLAAVRRTLSDLRRGKYQLQPELLRELRGNIEWIESVEPVRGGRLRRILEAIAIANGDGSARRLAGLT